MRKPLNLTYGVADRPPSVVLALLGLQHVLGNSVGFIILVAVMSSITQDSAVVFSVLQMSMITNGLGTILQASTRWKIGSGYFCPALTGPAYAVATGLAGKTGGMPLIYGMTLLSGGFEMVLAWAIPRLRFLFPAHVIGLIVTMVGFELIPLGVPRFLATHFSSEQQPVALLVAVITLGVAAAVGIWGRGSWKLYPVLVAVTCGWGAAYFTGVLPTQSLNLITQSSWVEMPHRAAGGFHFQAALLPVFLVAALASTLKTVGDISLCQRANDADWTHPDMENVSKAGLAAGLTTIVASLLGTVGHSTSSANVGLSIATGATSRYLAYSFGAAMIALALLPKLVAVFVGLPEPITGAILVYTASFMILSGMQLLMTKMMDTRCILVVGLAFVFGVSVELLPAAYSNAPSILAPIISSSLSAATVLVLILNAASAVRPSARSSVELQITDTHEIIKSRMRRSGAMIGASVEGCERSITAVSYLMEILSHREPAPARLNVEMTTNDFGTKVEVKWQGELLEIPREVPDIKALGSTPHNQDLLDAFLLSRQAHRLTSDYKNGIARILFEFEI